MNGLELQLVTLRYDQLCRERRYGTRMKQPGLFPSSEMPPAVPVPDDFHDSFIDAMQKVDSITLERWSHNPNISRPRRNAAAQIVADRLTAELDAPLKS